MNAQRIDKAEIRSLIPHTGTMCLLDEVIAWDEAGIHCRTLTHRDPSHPLARQGQLAALHLIEYGAQAMAIHGGLLARRGNGVAAAGMLVSAREIQLEVDRLDDLDAVLEIHATRLLNLNGGWLYRFDARIEDRLIGAGRVAVIPGPGPTL